MILPVFGHATILVTRNSKKINTSIPRINHSKHGPMPRRCHPQATGFNTMANFKLNDVRVILADSRNNVRSLLKSAFLDIGIRRVIDANKIEQVVDLVSHEEACDIMICDSGLSEELCDLVKDIRSNKIGRNPFVCLLGITWNPVRAEVERMVDAGIDSIIAAPLSPQQMFDRINSMVQGRLPFVVTRDYVGPDRRKDAERNPGRSLMEVPNTLRAKALGEWNAIAMERAVKRAVVEVQTRKMQIQAIDIAHYVELMIERLNTPGAKLEPSRLMQLRKVLIHLFESGKKLHMTHLDELSQATIPVIETLLETYAEPSKNDLELLKQLSMAIRKALHREARDKDVAREIAVTVQQAR